MTEQRVNNAEYFEGGQQASEQYWYSGSATRGYQHLGTHVVEPKSKRNAAADGQLASGRLCFRSGAQGCLDPQHTFLAALCPCALPELTFKQVPYL